MWLLSFLSSLFCKSKCQEQVWRKLWRWLLNTSSSTIQRYRIFTVYLFVLGWRWVFKAECQQGIPLGQFSLLPANYFKFSINLSGHVADLVGFLTWDPLLIWNTVSACFCFWETFILKGALRSNQSFSFNWQSLALLFSPRSRSRLSRMGWKMLCGLLWSLGRWVVLNWLEWENNKISTS